MKDNINIELNKKDLDKRLEEAKKRADEYSDDDVERYALDNLELGESDERYFDIDNNQVTFNGTLVDEDGERVGYLSFDLALDSDILVELVSAQIKKLGKVKTVLEAVKSE